MTEKLPGKSEFIVSGSLDERWAYRDFHGKTKDEVRAMLDDNFLHYQERFMFMGPCAFCFYIDAMIGYLKSTACDEDDVRIYISLCLLRLRYGEGHQLVSCATKVADSLEWLAQKMEPHYAGRAKALRKTRDAYQRLVERGLQDDK